MSKFCGKCGSQLNENGLCPRCDAAQIEKMNEPKRTYASSVTSDVQVPAKKKKSGKKAVKVIAIVLAVVIVLGASAGVLTCFNVVSIPGASTLVASIGGQDYDTSKKSYVVKNGKNDYYIGGACVAKLEVDNSITAVHYKDAEAESNENDDEKTLTLSIDKSVYDGNTFFAQHEDVCNELYKFTFIDDKTMERSVWVSEATLINSDVVTKKDNDNSGYTGNMSCWRLDGDYIYFIYAPGMDYFMSEKDVAYRLGRINKDGSSIEFIGNEIASTYTVKDGWIYYYDNGYTYNESSYNSYEIDYDRAGVYKMKGDGSQKQRLVNDLGEKGIESSYNDVCDKMEVYGDYLYFLNYSSEGKSKICRMKIDGSDMEYVSENGAYSYSVDTEKNKIYYVTGEYGQSSMDSRTMYETSLDTKTDEVLFEYGQFGTPDFSVNNNYLYFSNFSFKVEGERAGLRYNLQTNEKDKLNGYYEKEEINDDGFINYVTHGPYLNWEKAEDGWN